VDIYTNGCHQSGNAVLSMLNLAPGQVALSGCLALAEILVPAGAQSARRIRNAASGRFSSHQHFGGLSVAWHVGSRAAQPPMRDWVVPDGNEIEIIAVRETHALRLPPAGGTRKGKRAVE